MARTIHSNSATARTTTTSSTRSDKVVLTFTPDASSTYALLWAVVSDCVQSNSGQYADFRHDTAAVLLSSSDCRNKDVLDRMSQGGIAYVAFGASPGSQTFSIEIGAGNTVETGFQQAHLIAFKLTADDKFTTLASASTTSATLQTAQTLSWTPGTAGDYIILAAAHLRGSTTAASVGVQLFDGTTAYGYCDDLMHLNSTSAKQPWFHAVYAPNLSGAQNWSVLYASNGTSTATILDLYIVALRVSDWPAVFQAEVRGRTTTTQTTAQDKTTLTQSTAAGDHIEIVASLLDHSTSAGEGFADYVLDGTLVGVDDAHETVNFTDEIGVYRMRVAAGLTEASHEWKTRYWTTSGQTTGMSQSAIIILQPFDSVVDPVYEQSDFRVYNDDGTGLGPPP